MRVSLNIVKQFTSVDLPVDELVQRINQQLGGVEEVIDLGAKYKDARIVRVVEAEQHPNADRLRVCKIDDGGVTQDVPRDENGLVQVVCGAPNAHAGMYAVWLPPNSTVPASYDDAEPFVLSARELRGVLSQGMLAAADELAIGTDHDGIIEVNPDEWKPTSADIAPGASFAELYGLDDYAIDIENKMFTHRPDLFGQLGVAREIAGILGQQFTSPKWYLDAPVFESGEGLELEVFNDVPESAPRFMAVVLKDVEVKPSPLWLQCALVAMGGKPINNIVDVTNYIMLLTAQPTHAYDYDKLRGHKLGVRMARDGEKAELLNGKTYELTSDDIVIADGEGIVGLAGIMGGGNSEVSDSTKNIVLEVANFDMYAVRKSSMRHGVFTDALTRFNKGQSPLQNDHIMSLLMMSIKDVAGGKQASNVFDLHAELDSDRRDGVDFISAQFINERLGLALTDKEIAQLLKNVEIGMCDGCLEDEHQNDLHMHTMPFWRTDIELPEDVVEEVGRLYGFDKLPRELPMRSIRPTAKNEIRALKQSIRESLAKSGANEVLTYSFVHEKILKNAEQDPQAAFRLSNALSPDLQYYRLSVLPSLLDKVHMNIKAGHDEFTLFELGKGQSKVGLDSEKGELPNELEEVAAVYASKQAKPGAAFYQMRRLVEQLAHDHGVRVKFTPTDGSLEGQPLRPFDHARSAGVVTEDGDYLGMIGELKQSVVRNFKLPDYTAAMALLPWSWLSAVKAADGVYKPLSRFPSVTQDLSLKVDASTSYEALYDVVQHALAESADGNHVQLTPLAIYQSEDDDSAKTITLRVKVTNYDRTLRDEDVKPLLEHAAGKALETVGATLV